jgi:hypothetical protein
MIKREQNKKKVLVYILAKIKIAFFEYASLLLFLIVFFLVFHSFLFN